VARLKQALLAPRMESLFAAAVVLFGFRLGARPIGDNSTFTHLRTGIDMARTGAIPRVDSYSYTAAGEHWVVQSWLPEWTYGWAYRLGGFELVVLEQALLVAFLAWLVVRLARAGSPLRTTLASIAAVGVGTALWTPRPLLFGLICMALTISVVEPSRSDWPGSGPAPSEREWTGGPGPGKRGGTSAVSPPACWRPWSTRWAPGCSCSP
jgi:hypothetical protein